MNLFNKQHGFKLRHCQGFSMVELMVALVISMILMGGIAQIFLSSKKSFTIQDTLGRQQENGRYIVDALGQDIRRSGYMGSLEGLAAIGGTAVEVTDDGTCPTGNNNWGRMLSTRLFGLNDTNVSNISGTTYACIPDADYLRGDILVSRYQAPWIVGGVSTPAFIANRTYVRTSLNLATMFKGSAEADLSNGLPVVDGRTAELIARAYYVGPSTTGTCNGTTVPALFRETLDVNGRPAAEEVAYGVENFQVRYGLDKDGDGSVEQYVDAGHADLNTLSEWDDVIAARVWILTRGECPETGLNTTGASFVMGDVTYTPADTANRGFRRQLYQTTVTIRNRIRQ